MRNTTIAALIALGMTLAATRGVGYAAQPAVTACFGQSVSAESTALGVAAGQETAGLAQANTGVGAIVQQIQAGNVPDSVFQNTFNG